MVAFSSHCTVFLLLASSVFGFGPLDAAHNDEHGLIFQNADFSVPAADDLFHVDCDCAKVKAEAKPHHREKNHKTIYESLVASNHFTKLVKIINFDNETVDLLNRTGAGVTFFAPDDHAIPDPPKRRHPPKELDETYFLKNYLLSGASGASAGQVFADLQLFVSSSATDEKDKEKFKKFLKKLVHAILSYHVLPEVLPLRELGWNNTIATALKAHDGSFDGQARRVRITSKLLPKPSLSVNFFSHIKSHDWYASNGIIHVVSHPVLPPPSVLDLLFIFPRAFSTITSAIQKVDLEDAVGYKFVWDKEAKKGSFEGAPAITFFAPTNGAFNRLPPKLVAFLFSPFGERILKKLLQFHIVPDYIVHTEWTHAVKSDSSLMELPSEEVDETSGIPHKTEIFFKALLPTALTNHTIPVLIRKSRVLKHIPITKFIANGVWIKAFDGVARNGAIHVVDHVLNPRRHHKRGPHKVTEQDEEDNQGWEDWEDWLIDWVDQN